jgi:hypothetical protein
MAYFLNPTTAGLIKIITEKAIYEATALRESLCKKVNPSCCAALISISMQSEPISWKNPKIIAGAARNFRGQASSPYCNCPGFPPFCPSFQGFALA